MRFDSSVEGFHVMSYQSDFASRRTFKDESAILASSLHGAVKEKCPETSYLVLTMVPKLHPCDKKIITHT